MMQGGINNAALFGASQRSARSKLDQMAGIKRPSGILASSPELMQAAMPMPTTVAPMAPAPAPRSLNPMADAQGGIGFNGGGAIDGGMLFVDEMNPAIMDPRGGGAIDGGMLFVDEMNPAMMDPRIARRDARDARDVARDQERAMQQDARRLERDTRNAARAQEDAARDQRLAGILSLNQDRRDARTQAGQLKSDARNRARISSRIGSMENALSTYGSADEFYQGRLEKQRTGFGRQFYSTLPDSSFVNPADRYNTFLNSAAGEAQAKQIYNQMPQELDSLRSAYARLPNLPMNTAVASSPMNPMAQTSTRQRPVIKLNEGGDVSVAPDDARRDQQLRDARQSLDITMDSGKFKSFLKGLPYLGIKFLEETIGDEAAIAQVAQRKLNNIEAAAKSKDPAQTADQVMVEAGEKPTAAAKMDFAENVLGLDINDIDEINRRIDNVVVGSAVGKGPDEFAAAVLMGLQAFKQTASARAAGASGSGSNFTKDRTALRAYQDTLDSLTRSLSDRDLPEGYKGSVADYAAEQALKQVLKTYPANQIPPQLLAQARRPEPPAGGLETFLIEAQKINPGSSVEELTEFYTKKYGG